MPYQLEKGHAAILKAGVVSYGKGSRAKLESAAAAAMVKRDCVLSALSVPAARRPKVKDIESAIRVEMGADSKEADRGRYECVSLGFRAFAKLETVNPDAARAADSPAKLCDAICSASGETTESGVRAWVAGEKKEAAPKSPIDLVMEYLAKKQPELKSGDFAAIMKWAADCHDSAIENESRIGQAVNG